MKVKLLSEILEEHPNFEPGWQPKDGGICNPEFGYNKHVVICGDDGKPLWDQSEISESPGSIIVPYFVSGHKFFFGVVEQIRPVIKDSETGEQGVVVSTEFPMGFAVKGESLENTAKRELSEETNSVVKSWEYLGSINPLPALYADSKANEVFAANVDEKSIKAVGIEYLSKEAKKEGILSSIYILESAIYRSIKSGKMFCGLSQAAFAKFLVHREV